MLIPQGQPGFATWSICLHQALRGQVKDSFSFLPSTPAQMTCSPGSQQEGRWDSQCVLLFLLSTPLVARTTGLQEAGRKEGPLGGHRDHGAPRRLLALDGHWSWADQGPQLFLRQ